MVDKFASKDDKGVNRNFWVEIVNEPEDLTKVKSNTNTYLQNTNTHTHKTHTHTHKTHTHNTGRSFPYDSSIQTNIGVSRNS